MGTGGEYQDETMGSGATAQAAHNAYMLIYEKTLKSPVTVVLDEQIVQCVKRHE